MNACNTNLLTLFCFLSPYCCEFANCYCYCEKVIFIKGIKTRSNGTYAPEVQEKFHPQDVIVAINGVNIGNVLSLVSAEINKVNTHQPLRFSVRRTRENHQMFMLRRIYGCNNIQSPDSETAAR